MKPTLPQVVDAYDAEDVPISSYAILLSAYMGVFGGLYLVSKRIRPNAVPPNMSELALLTAASYKLSRIVTMSFIGSPLRAPFTKRGASLKGGEVQDVARGQGLQKAVGNLMTCPFCFNVWSTTAFSFGFRLAPQLTLRFAEILTIAALGDVLHFGYRNIRERSE